MEKQIPKAILDLGYSRNGRWDRGRPLKRCKDQSSETCVRLMMTMMFQLPKLHIVEWRG